MCVTFVTCEVRVCGLRCRSGLSLSIYRELTYRDTASQSGVRLSAPTMGNCSSTRARLAKIDLSTAKGGMQASQTVGQGGPADKQDCFILKERCLAIGSSNRLPPLAPQHVATLAC